MCVIIHTCDQDFPEYRTEITDGERGDHVWQLSVITEKYLGNRDSKYVAFNQLDMTHDTVSPSITATGNSSATSPANPTSTPSIISNLVKRIFSTRLISRTDQRLLMSLLNQTIISEEDSTLINQIYIGLHEGRLRVVD